MPTAPFTSTTTEKPTCRFCEQTIDGFVVYGPAGEHHVKCYDEVFDCGWFDEDDDR